VRARALSRATLRAHTKTTAFRQARTVWIAATGAIFLAALWTSGRDNNPASGFDAPALTRPFDGAPFAELLELVFSSLARWDSIHYLAIANEGYVGAADQAPVDVRAGFFPLYPFIVRVLSGWGAHPGAVLIAAYVVSITSFLVALYLLYRLVELELGDRAVARATLILLAASPFALYFVAPYTESLFLAIIVGAFYAARTGHWATAGVLGALSSACRVPGIAILAPLVFIYFYGPRGDRPPLPPVQGLRMLLPRYRPRLDALWLALVPSGIVAFSAYLHFARGDAFMWLHNQAEGGATGNHAFFPLKGLKDGAEYAWQALTLLAAKQPDTTQLKFDDLVNFGALIVIIVALATMWKRLPMAYLVCALAFVVIPLSATTSAEPLKSFARYATIAFPLFIWLAVVTERRKATWWVAGAMGVVLIAQTGAFARWQWVA
jgi:hypothetical protein